MSDTVWVPGALTTANQDRKRASWQARARATKATRTAATWAARTAHLPRYESCTITAQPVVTTRPGRIPDTGAHYPSIKAAIDGLVDAGVIDDDGPRQVRSIVLLAPVRATTGEGLQLTISTAPTPTHDRARVPGRLTGHAQPDPIRWRLRPLGHRKSIS